MKSTRLLLMVVLLSFSALAFAQSQAAAPQSDAQKSFTVLKSLAGTWEGHGTSNPPVPDMPDLMQISFRVTSSGHALMHEMQGKDQPGAKTQSQSSAKSHEGGGAPITMLYVDGDQLLLTHFCDAGNRPRMVGKISSDGKTVEFTFMDVSGSTQYGHMDHAVFTIIDANHHTEDWTYLMPGDKPMHGHIDLHRIN